MTVEQVQDTIRYPDFEEVSKVTESDISAQWFQDVGDGHYIEVIVNVSTDRQFVVTAHPDSSMCKRRRPL